MINAGMHVPIDSCTLKLLPIAHGSEVTGVSRNYGDWKRRRKSRDLVVNINSIRSWNFNLQEFISIDNLLDCVCRSIGAQCLSDNDRARVLGLCRNDRDLNFNGVRLHGRSLYLLWKSGMGIMPILPWPIRMIIWVRIITPISDDRDRISITHGLHGGRGHTEVLDRVGTSYIVLRGRANSLTDIWIRKIMQLWSIKL